MNYKLQKIKIVITLLSMIISYSEPSKQNENTLVIVFFYMELIEDMLEHYYEFFNY